MPRYQFLPMSAADLPLVRRWLAAPHVREWWGDPGEQFALVSEDLEQCYEQTAWPDNGLGIHPPGTRGIDQFIGEPDMTGRGHGSSFIRAFIAGLVRAGTPRVLTDPDPANARAIRAYEKAGFRKDRMVDTPDGRALLMVCNA
jgi:aminoglycoside 6'-N-acetyltransferase